MLTYDCRPYHYLSCWQPLTSALGLTCLPAALPIRRCVFCQNHDISNRQHGYHLDADEIADWCDRLPTNVSGPLLLLCLRLHGRLRIGTSAAQPACHVCSKPHNICATPSSTGCSSCRTWAAATTSTLSLQNTWYGGRGWGVARWHGRNHAGMSWVPREHGGARITIRH